jgi:heat shock protein HspQ
MKVGDLVRHKRWGGLGIVVSVPPESSMIEVFWSGEKPRRQKHLLGELKVLRYIAELVGEQN